MNLNELNTPSDLIAANKVADPVAETFKHVMTELDGIQAMALTSEMLQQLGSWHQYMTTKLEEEGETSRAIEWAKDEVLLEEAWQLVKRVYNNSTEDE